MLRLENITKYYYSSASVTCALRKVNMELKVGEFVAITGESGSGKTTLLNLISGLDSYEEGEIYFYDKKTSHFDSEDWEKYRKEEIAFIFQNYNLIDSYTVLENVIVTYIIDGYNYKDAKKEAMKVIKKVGLENDAHKKATKLSGGQKQRLSIARALAKNTNIIVADEPTGNLDSENGKMILELLKSLSKDKLVIVVTHNLSQIEPYITRKIRLHNGEVVLDEKIEDVNDIKVEVKNDDVKESKFKKIINFTLLNIKSQPKKVLLLLLIVLISTLATFVFYGNFKANLDEHKTKMTTNNIFYNLDDTRLLVKKNDNSVITNEIMNEALVDKVVGYEKYDYIYDVNYFRPSDYKLKLFGAFGDVAGQPTTQFFDSSFIELTDDSHYMRSSTALSDDMLSIGRLPENSFEMVVYSEDKNILNKEETVLFKNARIWGIDSWYQYSVKIVGLLKEPTEQAYFSDDICKILDLSQYTLKMKVKYKSSGSSLSIPSKELEYYKIAIDPNIGDKEMSFPKGGLDILLNDNVINSTDNLNFNNQSEYFTKNYTLDPKLDGAHTIGSDVIGVSREVFNEIYSTLMEKKQFAVFIEDYAYTDDVINSLINRGFESLSCFQASVTGYDYNKVTIRYVNLLISVLGLLGINIICIVLCFRILKVKKKDYVIFKMIGLTNDLTKKINYLEVIIYSILCFIMTLLITIIIKNIVNVKVINEIFKYIVWYDYLIVFVISILSMIILGNLFGKFLTKNVNVTVLKED